MRSCYSDCFEVRINDYCYTKAYIGHYCIFNEQCQGGSTCLNNYCGCEMGSAVEGNRCLNSTNECPMNQIRIQERCYSTSQIGGPCQHSQQCLGGSFCELGKCECPEDSVQTHDYCREMSARCPPTQVPIAEQCFDKVKLQNSS
ncbi:unnamed protein product [Anisakis simplex]|uniref:EB domain-containing protein n=1 Tax=Anisakis simplex TaxID=6269 RepID=A0A0M3JIX5_ANISI|nr:unnamed protein product [Anisakis simplex]